jgi:hypothetical protein
MTPQVPKRSSAPAAGADGDGQHPVGHLVAKSHAGGQECDDPL